nr:hypothetical protein [Bradyrhizobium sp. 2S1]MCK7667573.1 hypothetical protein [Bradyrhizobium sp. 2S1]
MAKPKLPATFAEAEAEVLKANALAYARESVRTVREERVSFCGMQLSWFEKSESQRFARERMKEMACSELGMMDLCNLARAGWGLADEAARELILRYKHRKEDMPPTLEAYNMEIVDPRRAYQRLPSKKKADNVLRDLAVTAIIGDVCAKFRLKPTRQRDSKQDRPSGCSIVALALQEEQLGIGESAVVEIWRRLGRMAFPDGPHAISPRAL